MPELYGLFISYSSHDLPWAERFEADIHRAYPWLKTFLDRDDILAGSDWRVAPGYRPEHSQHRQCNHTYKRGYSVRMHYGINELRFFQETQAQKDIGRVQTS